MATLEVYGDNRSLLYTPQVSSHAGNLLQPWDKDYAFLITGVENGESVSACMRLTINMDTGGKLIWSGVGIAITGFSLILFLSHRKLWVTIEKCGGDCRITIAGWTNRNPDILKHHAGRIKNCALHYRAA